MKKLILTFLLVLLPLQFAQAALCSYYCGELPVSSQQSTGPQSMDSQLPDQLIPNQPDSIVATDHQQDNQAATHRCAFCSMSHAKFINHAPPVLAIPNTTAPFQPEAVTYQSHISHTPERPNWMPFA